MSKKKRKLPPVLQFTENTLNFTNKLFAYISAIPMYLKVWKKNIFSNGKQKVVIKEYNKKTKKNYGNSKFQSGF